MDNVIHNKMFHRSLAFAKSQNSRHAFLYKTLPNNPSYMSDTLYPMYPLYLKVIYYVIDVRINFRYSVESILLLLKLLPSFYIMQ